MKVMPQVSRAIAPAIKKEPKDTKRIVDDMRKDPVFKLGVQVLKSMASSIVVSFETDGDDPRSKWLASHLNDVWDLHVKEALDAIEYGRQAFEIVHGLYGDLNTVADLVTVPFEISELQIDKETGCRGVLKVGKGKSQIELEPRHYWWATIDATTTEPFGKSRYRGAPYQVREQRKKLDQQEQTWYDRYSMGTGVARAPDETHAPPIAGEGDKGEMTVAGEPIDPAKAMADQLDAIRAGGWMILSSATYPNGGGLMWDLTQFPEVKDGAAIINRRNNLDVAALRSLGIPERALIQEGQTGAYSLAEAHQLVLNDTVEDIARQIIGSFQEQIVDRLCRLNELPKITITWTPIGDKSDQQGNELVRSVLTSSAPSPLLTDGVIDFIKIAESIGYPIEPGAKEALRRISERASSQAGSGGFGGFGGFGGNLALSMLEDVMQKRQGLVRQLSGERCCG